MITRRWDRRHPARESIDGARIIRVPPSGRGRLKKWLMPLACLGPLFGLRSHYDVILVPGFRVLGVTAVLIGALLGKRTVLRAASCGEMSGAFIAPGLARARGGAWGAAFGRPLLRLRNRVLRRADAFVAVSSAIEAELGECAVPSERIHRIPNGIDAAVFRPADPAERERLRACFGFDPAELVFVYAGRLVTYKGLPLLLHVWQTIRPAHPAVRLALIGSGGFDAANCEADLRRFVDEHELAGSVLFTGEVPNVEEYLQAADVFVLPSETEACSNAVIEAMACGLPVIATQAGGLKDVLVPGTTGLAFDVGDGAGLREAIERVIREPALRHALGQRALAFVRDGLTTDHTGEAYRRLFGSV